MLAYQLAGVAVLIAWGSGFCLVLFGTLKWAGILRVDSRMEVHGMDAMKHDEPAYPAESWEEQQYWDHQVHRLVELLGATALAGQRHNRLAHSLSSSAAVVPMDNKSAAGGGGLPPHMNFAHLVLTDHFQKCVVSLDGHRSAASVAAANRTKWHLQL